MNIYKSKKNGKLYTIGVVKGMYLGDGPVTAEPYNHDGGIVKIAGRHLICKKFELVGVR
jgi:hypothetical protein